MNASPSIHFSVEALDEHVFAAVHRPGGWAISNAGMVDLGDACLVFDTFLTVQAARDHDHEMTEGSSTAPPSTRHDSTAEYV